MQPQNALARMKLITQFLEISEYTDVRAESLSGGSQKRFEIGLAIINRPKLLVLDEPASGLDVILRNEIYDIVRRINKMGTTVILASHDLNILQRYVTSILIIDRGFSSRKIPIDQIKDLEAFFKEFKRGIRNEFH
jgi:ABC-type multidrug transport system ATPase subunit